MANAAVDKLKDLGIRQGEKVVVGIATLALLLCVAKFFSKETIATTPAELKSKADQAESNLNKKPDPEAVVARIEEAGIKDPGFVKLVENQSANALKPADYRPRQEWVTPEPGAGLIRDEPAVVVPTEVAVFTGRGGLLLYALDDKGEKIPDTSAGGTTPSGRPGAAPAPSANDEEKKRRDAEIAKKQRLLAGTAPAATKDEAAKKDEPAASVADAGTWKEETRGKRWVVITGVIDNEKMNKNWLDALKNPAIAYPQYLKVQPQRQTMKDDGTWPDTWSALNEDENYKVLDNIPQSDEELVPEAQRPATVVDPLPVLKAGYWSGVHVARLVPPDALKVPETNPGGMGEGGGRSAPSRSGGMSMSSSSMGMSRPGGMGMASSGMGMSRSSGGGPGMTSEGGGGRAGMDMGGGGGAEETVTPNNEKALMFRSLDFAVEPNTTYRYRVRLVVKNPNFERSDVNPGTNVSDEELKGEWSQPTVAVAVPADVSTYAQLPAQDNRRDDVVMFQVVRWNPATGQTVVKTDDAGPGFVIGEYGTVQEPSVDGSGAKSVNIDFNSRSIVLDAAGGRYRIPEMGLERNQFTVPAVALVVEPDGAVVVRNQAIDKGDEIRQDMEANYTQAIKDSGKKREKGNGTGRLSGRGSSSSNSGGGAAMGNQ